MKTFRRQDPINLHPKVILGVKLCWIHYRRLLGTHKHTQIQTTKQVETYSVCVHININQKL